MMASRISCSITLPGMEICIQYALLHINNAMFQE